MVKMKHCLMIGNLALATVGTSTLAHAEIKCGYLENDNWNVEPGGMVWNRSSGHILSAMDAVNEYRTHVAIYNGFADGGDGQGMQPWVSHATMISPNPSGYPTVCDDPLEKDQVQFPQPGASQTTLGGYYVYLHGGDGQGLLDYAWQRGNSPDSDSDLDTLTSTTKEYPGNSNRGWQVADWLWNGMPYGTFAGQSPLSNVEKRFFRLKWDSQQYVTYGLFQLRDIETANLGTGPTKNNGMVCSTLASYAAAHSGAGWVREKTYDHQQVRDGLVALFNSVYSQCRSDNGGFWKTASSSFCGDFDLCDEAAQQVVDCMALGICTDGESEAWEGVRDDPNARSRTISPDCVTGWAPGCPYRGAGASPWAWDANQPVVFSGGGRRFGCWD